MVEDIYMKLKDKYNFEIRNDQINLSKFIVENINKEKENIVIEAPTGSGKTMGYLIPAMLLNINEGKKIVISTNTLNLQDQIIEKELPILEKIINKKINYALIKGRGNYICRRRFEIKYFNTEEYDVALLHINKKNGDKNKMTNEDILKKWSDINSDTDLTLSRKCPFFSTCFYYNKKNEIDNSEIFIVNHHILMLDNVLKSNGEKGIIPNYDIAIIDEAHNLEKVVRNYYSYVFSFKENLKLIGRLYNRTTNDIFKSGLIYQLFSKVLESKLNDEFYKEIFENMIEISNEIYDTINEFRGYIIFNISKKENVLIDKNKFLDKGDIVFKIKDLIKFLNKSLKIVEASSSEISEINEIILLKNILSTLEINIKSLNKIFEFEEEKFFHHINYENDKAFPILNATPYTVSEKFSKDFLSKNNSNVFLSATLTTNNGFNDFVESLGINEYDNLKLNSPFNFDENMKIDIVKDLDDVNSKEFKYSMAKFCYEYSLFKNGQTLILFTSYSDLNFVYEYFSEKQHRLNVLKQGLISRNEILNIFKNNEKSVLLATDSFWEGVDIKGEALSNVIIPKLPFLMPDDPTNKSISNYLKKNNKNSFIYYQLPYAILKLKQGIGRLIRDKNDKGNIVILDKRLKEKKYAKIILKTFPTKNIEFKKYIDILK